MCSIPIAEAIVARSPTNWLLRQKSVNMEPSGYTLSKLPAIKIINLQEVVERTKKVTGLVGRRMPIISCLDYRASRQNQVERARVRGLMPRA